MDWNNARIVLAIHRGGSLTAAGRLLDLDQSTVGRRLAAFEEEMHVRLFERRDLRMVATREGLIVVAHAEKMEAEAFALQTQIRGRDDRAEGEVAVTAVPAQVDRILIPRIPLLRRAHPGIRLRLIGVDHNLSMEKGEADIALRLARPEEGRTIARRIARIAFRLHAHRDLLLRAGVDDPARLPWVRYGPDTALFEVQEWIARRYPDSDVALRVNSALACAAAVRLGIGIAVIPTYYVSDCHEVVSLSGPEPVAFREVWMLTLPEYRSQARIVPVMEWIREAFDRAAPLLAGERDISA